MSPRLGWQLEMGFLLLRTQHITRCPLTKAGRPIIVGFSRARGLKTTVYDECYVLLEFIPISTTLQVEYHPKTVVPTFSPMVAHRVERLIEPITARYVSRRSSRPSTAVLSPQLLVDPAKRWHDMVAVCNFVKPVVRRGFGEKPKGE